MYNDYMYAIDRSDEYLEHYGIKGMKWGVRKAIERGGTGLGNRRLARQYRKAQRKLAKLEKRANNGAKYAKRAAALGVGAAAAGGLAALGTGGVANIVKGSSKYAGKAAAGLGRGMRMAGRGIIQHVPGGQKVGTSLAKAGWQMENNADKTYTAVRKAGSAIGKWGKGDSIGAGLVNATSGATKAATNAQQVVGRGLRTGDWNSKLNPAMKKAASGNAGKVNSALLKTSNNTYARIGAAALGAGLAGAAGYNAYRAATTKKAAQKAADFRKEMNKTFAGTAYGKQGGSKKRRRR